MCKDFFWSDLYRHRRAIEARFGRIFALPLVKRVFDELARFATPESRVLEVGAGDRATRDKLAAAGRATRYESMDIDPRGGHDYHDLNEIQCKYDLVFALEVVEHLELAAIRPWLARLGELLEPSGHLLLSTPNTYYPPAFLRDATHRTPLCHDELGGLVESVGLKVIRVVRVHNDPLHRFIARRYLFGWLFRLIGIDFARQIVVIAKREA